MFVYILTNELYKGQYRKMILSFPAPQPLLDWLKSDGWNVVWTF